jgi:hypothetical protein
VWCARIHQTWASGEGDFFEKGTGQGANQRWSRSACDIDTASMDSLKVLDPKRPIREADMPAAKLAQARPYALIGPLRSLGELLTSARREATCSGIVGHSRFTDADEVGTLAGGPCWTAATPDGRKIASMPPD